MQFWLANNQNLNESEAFAGDEEMLWLDLVMFFSNNTGDTRTLVSMLHSFSSQLDLN